MTENSRIAVVGYKDPGETTAILQFTEQGTVKRAQLRP